MDRNRWKNRGQAIVMVTVALFAMCGLIGLAVDFGWAFFVKKAAQSAADAAALAAATESLRVVGPTGTYVCGGNVPCNAVPCNTSWTDAFGVGCKYAAQNGFTSGGKGGKQEVTIVAGTGPPPPTAPGVMSAYYWVTVRVTEQVPQLFSAVLGNPMGTVSARATAAVAESIAPGSVYGLNRLNDPSPDTGVDLGSVSGQGGGSATIIADGPVFLSSTASDAANLSNNMTVRHPSTLIRGGYNNSGTWQTPDGSTVNLPQTNQPDGDPFYDPLGGKGQPQPPPTSSLTVGSNIHEGDLIGDCNNPPTLQPGFYYNVNTNLPGSPATGLPINVQGCVNFASGTNWGEYVFFGGLNFVGSGGGTVVNFGPGRYYLAGARAGNNIFEVPTSVILRDGNVANQPNVNAGEIFVFTDTRFLDAGNQIPPKVWTNMQTNPLTFGHVVVKTGNNSSSLVDLHGLDDSSGSIPNDLKPFSPVVMWQDQRNSNVPYTPGGNIDTSCSGGSLDNPCYAKLADPSLYGGDVNRTTYYDGTDTAWGSRREMEFWSSPALKMWGAVYQPRGAWAVIHSNSEEAGPIQLVSGAYFLQAGVDVTLRGLPNPITSKTIALVE